MDEKSTPETESLENDIRKENLTYDEVINKGNFEQAQVVQKKIKGLRFALDRLRTSKCQQVSDR
jgi:hypothetical protein